jgi:hypothetical protein
MTAPTPAPVAGAAGAGHRRRKAPLTAAEALAASMSEADLERHMRSILRDLPQLLAYHTHDSRRSGSGFPDWCLVGPRGVMFRELKKQKGIVTSAQRAWLGALSTAGQDAGVWRPEDLASGRVARELAALAGLGGPP